MLLAACARATCGRQRDHRRDSGGDHRFDGRFDLVFMDIQMPGMDGLEAARLVVERYREAGRARPPIIATTANAYEEDRRRALDAGMDGFAVKPIGKSEVCHLFATFVDAKIDE